MSPEIHRNRGEDFRPLEVKELEFGPGLTGLLGVGGDSVL